MADFETFDLGDTLKNVETMKYMQSRTANDNMESNLKLQDYAGRLASGLVNEMAKTGIPQGTPEFQKKLDELAPPYRQQFQAMGIPVKDGPVSWEHLNALANANKSAQRVHSTVMGDDGQGGADYYNIRSDGTFEKLPIKVQPKLGIGVMGTRDANGNLQAQPVPGFSQSQQEIAKSKQAGKEAATVHEVENADNQKQYMTGEEVIGGGRNPNPLPTPAQAMPDAQNPAYAGQGGNVSVDANAQDPYLKAMLEMTPTQQAIFQKLLESKNQTAIQQFMQHANDFRLRDKGRGTQIPPTAAPTQVPGVAVPNGRNPKPAFGMTQAQKDAMAIEMERQKAEIDKKKELEVDAQKLQNKNQAEMSAAQNKRGMTAKNLNDVINTGIDINGNGNPVKIEDLIGQATGSGVGNIADATVRFFGGATKGATAASALKTIEGWLVSNIPRMEGPQSDFDVTNYQQMAAKIGDPSTTPQEKLAALNTLKSIIARYSNTANVPQTPQTPNAQDGGLSPDEQAELDQLRKRFGR